MEWFIQHRVLHGVYRTKEEIPEEIHYLAVIYEGFLPKCTGWNMPTSFTAKHVPMTSPLRPYLSQAEYIIVYPKSDLQTKKHELLHALYAMNPSYRQEVSALWGSLPPFQQQCVRQVLLGLGYPDRQDLLLDEFQAYYYTEKRSFFGKSVASHGIGKSVASHGIGKSVASHGIGKSVASHGIGIGTGNRTKTRTGKRVSVKGK